MDTEGGDGEDPTDEVSGGLADGSSEHQTDGGGEHPTDGSGRRFDAFAVCGHALMAVGAWLPWVGTDPTGVVPMVYLTGMDSGLETFGAVVLPLAVLSGLVHALPGGWRRGIVDRGSRALSASAAERIWPASESRSRSVGRRWTLSRATAAISLAAGGYYVVLYPPLAGAFRPGSGVYVTLVGAAVVFVTARLARRR